MKYRTFYKKIPILCALSFLSFNSFAQKTLLCVTEAVSGVSYDSSSKKWRSTAFKNNNEKHFLIENKGEWKYKTFEDFFEAKCNHYRIGSTQEFRLICPILEGEFRYGSSKKRFLSSYLVGYFDGSDNNNNTPAVSIGTCTEIK